MDAHNRPHGAGTGRVEGLLMSRLLAPFTAQVSWREIARRTVRESLADNTLGMAAQLAYYFFFALFPALLFLLALASFFPIER